MWPGDLLISRNGGKRLQVSPVDFLYLLCPRIMSGSEFSDCSLFVD